MRAEVIVRNATLITVAVFAWSGAAAFATPLLLPLNDRDLTNSSESGCNFSFDVGRSTLMFGIADKLMIRTSGGRAFCRVGEGGLAGFMDGKSPLTCNGRTLRLIRAGRVAHHQESDSASWPATLTITHRGAARQLRGNAGTAC